MKSVNPPGLARLSSLDMNPWDNILWKPPTENVPSQSLVSDWIRLIAFWGVLLMVNPVMNSDISGGLVILVVQSEVNNSLWVGPIVFNSDLSASLRLRSISFPSCILPIRVAIACDEAAIISMLALWASLIPRPSPSSYPHPSAPQSGERVGWLLRRVAISCPDTFALTCLTTLFMAVVSGTSLSLTSGRRSLATAQRKARRLS